MIKVVCVVVGEGSPFSVKIAPDEIVDDLKKLILGENSSSITCDAKELQLYGIDGLTQIDDEVFDFNGTVIEDFSAKQLNDFGGSTKKLVATFPLSMYPQLQNSSLGKIHVLVVVPEIFESNKRQRHDVELRELYGHSSMEGLAQLPQVSELAELLLQPLPFRLEILDSILAKKIFNQNAQCIQSKQLEGLINSITAKYKRAPPSGASESLWQSYYDVFLDLTHHICAEYGFPVDPKRNQVHPASTKQHLRPDYILCHNEMLLLRGEEKSAGFHIDVPLKELTDKMVIWNPMFYGELPYIFGYATSGAWVSIVAIDQRLVRHEILNNSFLLIDPSEVLKFFYNISFFFKVMSNKSNRHGNCVFLPYTPKTSGNRTMELEDIGFKRTFQKHPDPEDFDRLLQIYQTLQTINERNSQERTYLQVVNYLTVSNTTFKLLLTPLGMERKPLNSCEVEQCLHCILIALKYWHFYGYCHGDIRWPNIVYVQRDPAYWMLIDMDESYPNDTKLIDWNHPRTGEKLTFQHDLYQLGKIFSDFTFVFPNVQPVINECLNSLGSFTSAESLLSQFFHT